MATGSRSKEESETSLDENMEIIQKCMKETGRRMLDLEVQLSNRMQQAKDETSKAKSMFDEVQNIKDEVKRGKDSLDKEKKEFGLHKSQMKEKEDNWQQQDKALKEKEVKLQQQEKELKEKEQKLKNWATLIGNAEDSNDEAQKKLELEQKTLQQLAEKHRKEKHLQNLREEECKKREVKVIEREKECKTREAEVTERELALMDKEAQLDTRINRFEFEHTRSIETAAAKKQNEAKREKELEELKQFQATLMQLKEDLDRREKELKEKSARHKELQTSQLRQQVPALEERGDIVANSNESNQIIEDWVPMKTFLENVEALEHLDLANKEMLDKIVLHLLHPNDVFMRCPKMCFEMGVGRADGKVETLACGRGEVWNDALKNLISDMKSKIKAQLRANSSRAPSMT